MIAPFFSELEQVFGWLLAASWQASVLALFVLVLQRLLGAHLNPRWRYALWLLVLARLLLPALPESALSLFQFAPPPPAALEVTVTEPLFHSAPPPFPAPNATADIAPPAYPFTYYTLFALVWLVGAITLLVVTWLVNRRFAQQVARAPAIIDPELLRLFIEAKAELDIHRPIRLIESTQIQGPAIMGLFSPTLLLPADVRTKFDPRELRFIFLHELAHLKRGDVIVQALIALLQILHWFNPVLWYAFRRMRTDREPATDALVLSRTGEAEKEHYGLMLIKLLEHFNQRHSLPTLVGILEDKDQFKRRFSLIAKFTCGAYGWSLLGILIIAVLAVTGLTRSKGEDSPKTAADLILRLGRFVDGVSSMEYAKTGGDPTTGYSYERWREMGDFSRIDFFGQNYDNNNKWLGKSGTIFSYDGDHGYNYPLGSDRLLIQKEPFTNLEEGYSSGMYGPLFPFQFLEKRQVFPSSGRVTLQTLKSHEALATAAARAVLVPEKNRSWNGHPCIAVKISDGNDRWDSQAAVDFIAYFATDLDFYPIACEIYKHGKITANSCVTKFTTLPLGPDGSKVFRSPVETQGFRYDSDTYHSSGGGGYAYTLTPDDYHQELKLNTLTKADFTLQPPPEGYIEDLDAQKLTKVFADPSADPKPDNGIQTAAPAPQKDLAAIVNGKPIYWSDLARDLDYQIQFNRAKANGKTAELKVILFNAINRELIVEEGDASGFVVPQGDLDAKVDFGVKGYGGDKNAFTENLKKSGLSLEQFNEFNRRSSVFGHMYLHSVDEPARKYLKDNPPTMVAGANAEEVKKSDNELFQTKSTELANNWYNRLRAKATIQTFAAPTAAAHAGQAYVRLLVAEVTDTNYQAHQADIDAAVKKGDPQALARLGVMKVLGQPAVYSTFGQPAVIAVGIPQAHASDIPDTLFNFKYTASPSAIGISLNGTIDVDNIQGSTQISPTIGRPNIVDHKAYVSADLTPGQTKSLLSLDAPGGSATPETLSGPYIIPTGDQKTNQLARFFFFVTGYPGSWPPADTAKAPTFTDASDPASTSSLSAPAPDPAGEKLIRVALKILQVDEDDYQAHRADIDAAVQKGDFKFLTHLQSFDLLSEPAVLTKAGEQGVMEAVRVLPYAVAFAKGPDGKMKPTDFKRQNLGVRFVLRPTITANQIQIDGNLNVTSLLGWSAPGDGPTTPNFHVREATVSENFALGQTRGFEMPGGAQMEPLEPSEYYPPAEPHDDSKNPKALRRLFFFLTTNVYSASGQPINLTPTAASTDINHNGTTIFKPAIDRPTTDSVVDLDTLQKDLLTAKEDADARRVLFNSVKDLPDDQFFATLAGLGRSDSGTTALQKEISDKNADIAALLHSGFTAGQPRVQAMQAELASLEDDLKRASDGIHRSMAIDLQMADSRVALLQNQLGAAGAGQQPAAVPASDPAATSPGVTVSGWLKPPDTIQPNFAKSNGDLVPDKGPSYPLVFDSKGFFTISHVQPGTYRPIVRLARDSSLGVLHVAAVLGPIIVGTIDCRTDIEWKPSDVSPPPGNIQLELKISEIDDDVYLANKDKIDGGLKNNGVAVLTLINNMKGASLLSAPSVTTQPGLKATIDIVREFPYPTSFEPGKTATISHNLSISAPPTPREFTTKNVGVSADIMPTLDEGKIETSCALHITDFVGFTETNQMGKMPAFSTREVNLAEEFGKDDVLKGALIPGFRYDDETVTDRDDNSKVISTTQKNVKKRLLVFLSARLVPPGGSPAPR